MDVHPPHSTMVGIIGFHLPAQQFWGMNPYKSQLFWCEQQGLTHVFLIIDSHMSTLPPEGDEFLRPSRDVPSSWQIYWTKCINMWYNMRYIYIYIIIISPAIHWIWDLPVFFPWRTTSMGVAHIDLPSILVDFLTNAPLTTWLPISHEIPSSRRVLQSFGR